MTQLPGRIVLLNGAPRSGKTSVARALQARSSDLWVNLGVDAFLQATPAALHPGIGLRPGGERPQLEPTVQRLYAALFAAISGMARTGVNVVADLGIHDDFSQPLGVLGDAAFRLEGLPVLFVGIVAPLDTIMQRRNADPRNGYYAAGADVPPPVQRWQSATHAHGAYDLTIDTSELSPEEAAAEIERALAKPPTPSAFERLSRAAQ